MSSWWPPSEALSQKLESLLSLGEDISYFPSDAYEERRGRFLLRVIALLALAVVAHLPGLTNPWLWTDLALVPGNPLLHSIGGLVQFWVHPVTNGQAPLAQSVLYLEFLAFNNSPFGYHLVTLLAHAGGCILLWLILRRLDVPGAWLAAAIFAVHPIEVQSVSWASRQGDVLACLAGLGSLLTFLNCNEIHPPAPAEFTLEPPAIPLLRATSIGLFAAAVLCQPCSCMLAAVFAITLRWKRGKFGREELLIITPFVAIAAFAAALAFYFSLTMHFGGPAAALSPIDRILISGRAAWFYAESLVFPVPLIFIYPRWHLNNDAWMAVFPAGVIAAVAGLWWARRWFGDGPLAATLCYLCLVVPHLPLVRSEWLAYSFVGDHLQYIAGIPLIVLLAAALARLAGLVRSEHWQAALRLAGGAAILGSLGTLSWFTTLPYANEERLWKTTLASEPSSPVVRAIFSQFFLKQGKLTNAAQQFPENIVSAMRLQASRHGAEAGGVAGPMLAWAHVLEEQHRYSDAAAFYQQVLAIDPRSHEAAIRLAWSYKERGDNANAIRSFAEAVTHYPADETLQNDFGLALADSGNFDQAIAHYRAAIRLNSNYVAARINLSKALFSLGKYQESSEQLKIASDLDPRSFDAFFTAGLMLANLKNYPASERMFKAAVQLRPESAEACNDLGIVQAAQGFFNDAVDNFIRAVKLNPDFKEARDNLARARQERDARQQ